MKLLMLAALVLLLVPSSAWAPTFMADPSVRVDPNVQVEFEWRTDVTWFGHVTVYDNPDGTGAPVAERRNEDALGNPIAATQHTVVLNADGAPLAPDTRYFFKITATDPTGSEPSFSTPTPLPSFFTGVQAIGDVLVEPFTESALISWDANVIGSGRVEILSPAGPGPFGDASNTTDHSIALPGLQPGTTYEYRVSNRHAIDGDALAEQTGTFVTLEPPPSSGPQFTAGPSIRVDPNAQVEFEWKTNVTWFGHVSVYDNPDGTGIPVAEAQDEDALGNPIAATQHTVVVNVTAPLAPDTRYFFRVTSTDPSGSTPPFSTPAPLPPFFTGVQAIGDVSVEPGSDGALISWDANVIGHGRVEVLSPAGPIPVDDARNTTSHRIELTGLQPGTTYEFRVSNRHALDGDSLAAKTGSFTTQSPDSTPPTISLTTPPEGAVYLLNETVNADYACQDEADGSGLASCLGDLAAGAPIDTATVGAKTFTVTAADNAGKVSSVTHSYVVVYSFSGFLDPVKNPNTVNTGKAGRTYPVKWQLRDANGSFITDLSALIDVVAKPTSCAAFSDDLADALETSSTGATSLRYDTGSNQYIYNWASPSTPGCYTLFLRLDSGQAFPAYFRLS